MAQLKAEGCYQIDADMLEKLQARYAAGFVSEEGIREEIARSWKEEGYLMDTHTAVASAVLRAYTEKTGDKTPAVIVSTASPYKFPRVVLEALGMEVPVSDFDAIEMLEKFSGMKASENLVNLKGMNERFKEVIAPEQIAEVALQKC